MKKTMFLSIFLLATQFIYGQSITQQVFSAAGQTTGQIAYTIGEPLTNTLTATNATIAQGFHQPSLTVVHVDKIVSSIAIQLFPNPSATFFTIAIDGYDKPTNLTLYDMLGQVIWIQYAVVNGQKILVNDLPSSAYLVKIETENSQILSCIKFVKL